ncbi:hypothetical protein ACWFRJ_23375 [Streptomyces sp. NPDC055239]
MTLDPVALGVPEGNRFGERPRRGRVLTGKQPPRRGLVLTAAAAVMAIALGAYVYHDATSVKVEPPSDKPTPTGAATPTTTAPPTGAIPKKYLGTWENTIDNELGPNSRWMVIQQGDVGDTVVTLTAVGPTSDGDGYRCVFEAPLKSVTSGAIRLSSSTVTSAKPSSACKPGAPSTLTLLGEDQLRRVNSDGNVKLTYDRTRSTTTGR